MKHRILIATGGLVAVAAIGALLLEWDAGRTDAPAAQSPDVIAPAAIIAPTAVIAPPAVTIPAAVTTPTAVIAPAAARQAVVVLPIPPAEKPKIVTPPSFDVVRVNPMGLTVIAGRAAPNAEIAIVDAGTTIGQATANERGEWVSIPDKTLSPGSHSLSVTARSLSVTARDAGADAGRPPEALAPDASASDVSTSDASESDVSTSEASKSSASASNASASNASTADTLRSDTLTLVLPAPSRGAAAPAGSPLSEEPEATVVVRSGNSLWRIARRSYGKGGQYALIYKANHDRIGDPDLIYPGQVFTLPVSH